MKGSTLSYSHGFNIVEEGMQIRKDITVMCAPNPGSEVREEYKEVWSTYFNRCTSGE
jgi:ketol-acid reductoisomerase